MRIALDATYSTGDALSGVGVYSRELLHGLAATKPSDEWDWFYRSHRYWRARLHPHPSNVAIRWLRESSGNRKANLFHALNQRLPKLRFARQVVTFHDLFVLSGEYSSPEFRQRFAQQARQAAAGADLVIAVSAFTAAQITDHLQVPPSRIRVVHHGVLPRAITAAPREKIILCVGALQKRKNQSGLVRAFAAAPKDWKLVLAGSQGFESAAILNEIASSPAAARIQITGYLSDEELASLYSRASIFAFPSLDEGFGMPALEAMAAGIPVIAGNRSSLPEICGNAAMLVDPNRDDELVHALKLLTDDPDLREKMSAPAIAHASTFTWQKAVAETLAVYRELLDAHP